MEVNPGPKIKGNSIFQYGIGTLRKTTWNIFFLKLVSQFTILLYLVY